MTEFDADVVVVGSGFGGAVTALRRWLSDADPLLIKQYRRNSLGGERPRS